MSDLTPREKELVAIGAAIGSNCVPCIEYHIPIARKNGITDAQIVAAIELANKVKQVPARMSMRQPYNWCPVALHQKKVVPVAGHLTHARKAARSAAKK